MNLAWEVMLRAMEQGNKQHELKFTPILNGSPYREANFEELNLAELFETAIYINPLYRFSHIFGTLLDINETEYPELREMAFDVFMHIQSKRDLRAGLTKSGYYVRAILRDMLTGAYGTKASETITLFSNSEAQSVLYNMLMLFRKGTSMELFRYAARLIYPNAFVYRNNDVYRELLIYLPQQKNDVDEKKLNFLISIFLDINYTVYTFWGRHFGVIGFNETLKFEQMLLF